MTVHRATILSTLLVLMASCVSADKRAPQTAQSIQNGNIHHDPTVWSPSDVIVSFQRFLGPKEHSMAEFEAKNTTSRSLWFASYVDQEPTKEGHRIVLYDIQNWTGQQWAPAEGGWCGNGTGWLELPSGQKVTFPVWLEKSNPKRMMRVGIRISQIPPGDSRPLLLPRSSSQSRANPWEESTIFWSE